MADEIAGPEQLDALEALIDRWLAEQLAGNPAVAAVDRGEPGERRWYVRLRGEQKDTFTIWFTLGQRTLHYETYVMPAPEENHAALYEHLLRRNLEPQRRRVRASAPRTRCSSSARCGVSAIDEGELDRILGSLYAWVEQFFRPAMRIGFASLFKG